MDPHHLKQIHEFISKKGDEIQSILPPLPGHPVRQAQAHLYKEIKLRFGVPAKDVRDSRFDEVMRLLEICVEHAAEPGISKYLTWVEPEPSPNTLEDFFENS